MEPSSAIDAPKSRHRKRLIVLCDGTWQDSTSADETEYPTNVTRFSRCLSKWTYSKTIDGDKEEIEQVVYYQKGVGTGLFDKYVAGASGLGVSANVREAYGFLCHNYDPGDQIYFFGYSRGAYTARAIAGLVTAHGLLTKRGMDSFSALYNMYYENQLDGRYASQELNMVSQLVERKLLDVEASRAVEIIGLWDTAPFHQTWVAKLMGSASEKVELSNTVLSPKISYGFHALALDEARSAFTPQLWTDQPSSDYSRVKEVSQVWFSGIHSDVGGQKDHRLCDVTLSWMIAKCTDTGLLGFDENYILESSKPISQGPWSIAKGIDGDTNQGGFFSFFPNLISKVSNSTPRKPMENGLNESIHCSIRDRSFDSSSPVPGLRVYPSNVLTGDESSDGWQLKYDPRKRLPVTEASELELKFRGRVRAAYNEGIGAAHV